MKKWGTYLIFSLGTLAIGSFAGLLSSKGMEQFQQLIKPPLTPPDIAFPIVWSFLYLLMGWSAARVYRSGNQEWKKALMLYGAQLALNFFWTLIFFNGQWYLAALLWLILLWFTIVAMIRSFWDIDPAAAKAQIPYLIWVAFAGYLNAGIWFLNR